MYEVSGFVFALFDISDGKPFRNDDSNDSLSITQNTNLFMVGMGEPPTLLASMLTSLQPGIAFRCGRENFFPTEGTHFPAKSRESSSNRRISQQEMEKRLFGGKNCLGGDP